MHVGVIGTGRIGAFHARLLASSPLVRRLTLADRDPGLAAGLARSLGVDSVASPEDVVTAGVDALVIAAATPAHAPLLHLAADHGLPAFCEKPVALDLAATDAVADHVSRSGILVHVGFQRRFDAGYQAAREAVRCGTLGEVHLIRLASHDPEPPAEAYLAGSGGIFRDLAIHDLDIAPWVLGRPVVEVYADGATRDPVFQRYQDVDVAVAVLRFQDGPMGVLTASRYDPRGYDIRLELLGSRDSLVVGLDDRTPIRSLEPGVPPPARPGWRDFMERFEPAYRAELTAFLEAVRSGGPSPCTVQDARQALVLALAAERSRTERRPVAVSEVG